jgi:hypothetical protein
MIFAFFLLSIIAYAFFLKRVVLNEENIFFSLLASFVLTPVFFSAVLLVLLALMPGRPELYFQVVGFAVFMLPVYYLRFLKVYFREAVLSIKDNLLLSVVVFGVLVAMVYVFIKPYPALGSDMLQYYSVGEDMFYNRALYQVGSQTIGNRILLVAHPPLFPAFLSFLFFLNSNLVDSANLFYSHLFLLIVIASVYNKRNILGFVVLLAVLIVGNVSLTLILRNSGIDGFRFNLFAISLLLFGRLKLKYTIPKFLLFIVSVSFGFGSHSSGVLFLILMVIIYLLLMSSRSLKPRIFDCFLIVLFCSATTGLFYLNNIIVRGYIVSDTFEVLENLDYYKFLPFERNVYNFKTILRNGLFPWLNFKYYGVGFYFFLVLVFVSLPYILKTVFSALCFKYKAKDDKLEYLLFYFGFLSVVIISVLKGEALVIKNIRYLLTPYFAMIIYSGFLFSNICEKLFSYGLNILKDVKKFLLANLNILKDVKKFLLANLKNILLVFAFVALLFPSLIKINIQGKKDYKYLSKLESSVPIEAGARVISFYPFSVSKLNFHLILYYSDEINGMWKAKTSQEVYDYLKTLKIDYIVLYYYTISGIEKSVLQSFLNDVRFIELESKGMLQIYKIRKKPLPSTAFKRVFEKDFEVFMKKGKGNSIQIALAEGLYSVNCVNLAGIASLLVYHNGTTNKTYVMEKKFSFLMQAEGGNVSFSFKAFKESANVKCVIDKIIYV